MNNRKNILVFADWHFMPEPMLMGTLEVDYVRNKEVFSFEYSKDWLKTKYCTTLDPDLKLYSGKQFAADLNFGVFLDSAPDRWGRTLIDRRNAMLANESNKRPKHLYETDYLLFVNDETRMGAVRFKTEINGPFLNADDDLPVPPATEMKKLQQASWELEKAIENNSFEAKWIKMLLTPGSSLGGARPKANIRDETGNLWIAKFPSKNDLHNVGAWEMVTNELAIKAGILTTKAKTMKIGNNDTFLSKRFDRGANNKRIHFASAMTLLGYKDGNTDHASYLELAEFIMRAGANPKKDLEELWRRIVFNIAVSNTDDHLRNHGFLLSEHGWNLSPAYDVNPVAYGNSLNLNISLDDNSKSIELALSVAEDFHININKAASIIDDTQNVIRNWRNTAKKYGIGKLEQNKMMSAFEMPR